MFTRTTHNIYINVFLCIIHVSLSSDFGFGIYVYRPRRQSPWIFIRIKCLFRFSSFFAKRWFRGWGGFVLWKKEQKMAKCRTYNIRPSILHSITFLHSSFLFSSELESNQKLRIIWTSTVYYGQQKQQQKPCRFM